MAQHGACLNLLILLANVEAVDGCKLDLITLDLTNAIDHARWPDLAQEAEVKLLQFHVLFGPVAISLVLECRHQVLLDERLDFVMLLDEHGVQELELLLGVTVQRVEYPLLVMAKELVHQFK